jgi:hypothetical protein
LVAAGLVARFCFLVLLVFLAICLSLLLSGADGLLRWLLVHSYPAKWLNKQHPMSPCSGLYIEMTCIDP